MKVRRAFVVAFVVVATTLRAQTGNGQLDGMGMNVYLPTFEAHLSLGFNYDLLRSLTDVSFDNSKGYFGFNIPVEQTMNLRSLTSYMDPAVNQMFNDTTLIKNGNDFKPQAGARQNPNMSVRVDVPMLGGTASFSDVQNFYMNYQTVLGNPNLYLSSDTAGVSFLLRGTLNVPLNLSMSWETMTFAYAYNVNKWAMFAVALNRHVFSVDLRGKFDADLLGTYKIDLAQGGNVPIDAIEGDIDYPSSKVNGQIYGYYEAEVWTPSLAVKLWRFSLDARFGIKTRAKGELIATYSLPFFIDPETFKTNLNFNNPAVFNDPNIRTGLQTNAVDSMTYTTQKSSGGKTVQSDLEWTMPTALTMNFDIIPDHLSISYTKLFGDVGLRLDKITKVKNASGGDSTVTSQDDSLVLDLGLSVDDVMLLHLAAYTAYLNLGVFAMDLRSANRTNILGSVMMPQMRLGKAAMLPVLNLGTLLGSRWQVLLEVDVLPLPALRSGLVYNF